MTDLERFLWMSQHPVATAGIATQFSDQALLNQHWNNNTPEQHLEHFRKVIDYTIKYS